MTVMTLVVLPEEERNAIKEKQEQILSLILEIKRPAPIISSLPEYVTAKEFMAAIRIKRTKFDQLVASGRIRIIKKRHKIYLPATEIERYFKDSSIP